MFDIDFYMKFHTFREEQKGKTFSPEELYSSLEQLRNPVPVVYNIETTNACNMACKMCPRTTMMTRRIETINKNLFHKIADQLTPHPDELWQKWLHFIQKTYAIPPDEMSENHFFLYVIPRVIQLHGYGDPLLDPSMHEYIALLHERGLQSYFSCNPANIMFDRTCRMLDAGLDYIKYSIESVDDEIHREIRGEHSNFTQSYRNILKVLEYKEKQKLNTTVVITMLDLNRKNQRSDYQKLLDAFRGLDVYIYLKSENGQWYRKDYHGTHSIHWSEVCRHPWMSMTVKSNGEAAMCMEDFNNEIILGNTANSSLYDIWNGEAYQQFRMDHIRINQSLKCSAQCDMLLMGNAFRLK